MNNLLKKFSGKAILSRISSTSGSQTKTQTHKVVTWNLNGDLKDNTLPRGRIALTAGHPIWKQILMLDLNENDLSFLLLMKPYILEHLDDLTTVFYGSVLRIDELNAIIQKHSTIDKLKKTLRAHIEEMFNGIIDDQYISKRIKIATVHQHIGLESKWYIGAFHNLQQALMDIILVHVPNVVTAQKLIAAVYKVFNLEQQLVLDSYEERFRMERERQYETVKNELKHSISNMSEQLMILTTQTSQTVLDLINRGQDMNITLNITSTAAIETEGKAEAGGLLMEQLIASIQIIDERAREMHESVAELKNTSSQIKSIVSAVKKIADQTNLLSLNASIEAARAGTHGAGFAVVAKEVNKLASHTKETVYDIEQLIQNSSEVTNAVIHMITQVRANTDQVRQSTDATSDALRNIVARSSMSSTSMTAILGEMKELIVIIQGIEQSTQQVAHSAEELRQTTIEL